MSHVEQVTPLQIEAHKALLERRARLGDKVTPLRRRLVIPAEPIQPPKSPATEIVVAKVNLKSEPPITLTEIPAPLRKRAMIDRIRRAVCAQYNIYLADLIGPLRTAPVVKPRQIAMYLCREMTHESWAQIGRYFGGRDHTTVLHAYRKIERLIATDMVLAAEVAAIRAVL